MGCGSSTTKTDKAPNNGAGKTMEPQTPNPNARNRNRRSSLKPAHEIEAELMKPYRDPIKAFLTAIHFTVSSTDGEEAKIPWTSFRRAVLYQWVCNVRRQPGLGILPVYKEKEHALSFKGINQLRGMLNLPAIEYHQMSASEVITVKRFDLEAMMNKCKVRLTSCPGMEGITDLTDDDKTREGLNFSTLLPNEDIGEQSICQKPPAR